MSISFRRFRPEDRSGIEALNERLRQGGVTDRVYPEAVPGLASNAESVVTQELYVAADGESIRGGVWLHEQQFTVGGIELKAGWLKYPVAESLIDRTYSGVPAGLILTLMRRQPHLMALGMGGRTAPLARLLEGLSWTLTDVPFGVAPLRATRVLKELRVVQAQHRLAKAVRLIARTHTAPLGLAPINLIRKRRLKRHLAGITVIRELEFAEWSERLWKEHRGQYPFIGRRDTRMLNRMYPGDAPGIARYRLVREGQDVAWLCTRTMGSSKDMVHPQFGRLKVGMIVDAVASPSDSEMVFAAAFGQLAAEGVDLIVSNQLHPAWRAAMKSLLLLPAPSNFVFAHTNAMKTLLQQSNAEQEVYITRGDCDGPPWW